MECWRIRLDFKSAKTVKFFVGRRAEYSMDDCEKFMKIVPVIKSGDLERSLGFYTQVLDFERKWP